MSKVTLTVNGHAIPNNWTAEEVEASLRRPASQGAGIPVPNLTFSGAIEIPVSEELMDKLTQGEVCSPLPAP